LVRREELDEVLYELKAFLGEEEFEELLRRGQATLFEGGKVNHFIEKPRVERVVLKMHSPLVFRIYYNINWSSPHRDSSPLLQHGGGLLRR